MPHWWLVSKLPSKHVYCKRGSHPFQQTVVYGKGRERKHGRRLWKYRRWKNKFLVRYQWDVSSLNKQRRITFGFMMGNSSIRHFSPSKLKELLCKFNFYSSNYVYNYCTNYIVIIILSGFLRVFFVGFFGYLFMCTYLISQIRFLYIYFHYLLLHIQHRVE